MARSQAASEPKPHARSGQQAMRSPMATGIAGIHTRRSIIKGALLTSPAIQVMLNQSPARGATVWSIHTASGYQSTVAETLVFVTNRSPSDLDPHSAYDEGSNFVLQGPFETLIRVEHGTTDRYQPVVAQSWESNDDLSVWTFYLNVGVTFQDGSPCDAEAVRASFERLLAIGLGPSTVFGRFVQNATQISTPDAKTVIFNLDRPQPLFEAAIAAFSGGALVNARLAKEYEIDGDWGHGWAQTTTEGLGTGPYQISAVNLLERTVLERNLSYWGGWDGHHVDQVIVRIVAEAETRRELIEQADADIAENIAPDALAALSANANLVVDLQYNLTVVYFILTVAGPLKSPIARRALCFAFPYNEVIDGVYNGYAKRAIGPCAELCRGFSSQTFAYETDLERAGALFEEAGVPIGTTLKMLVPVSSPWAGTIAQLLAANLDLLGLKLETQLVDYATLINIYYGGMPAEERPHIMPSFWSPDYNDGWNHLWPQVASAAWSVGNAGHYVNAEVDGLLEEARNSSDEETYLRALSQVQQIVTYDDPAAIYALQPQWPVILRNDVGGFVPNLVSPSLHDFYRLYRRKT